MPLTRAEEFDLVGALHGTDKSSAVGRGWDYLRKLDKYLAGIREDPITLIEIGVRGGASLHTWTWYFPQARIIGIDINRRARKFEGGRISIAIGSQADAAFLASLCAETPPTVVVDDGSHLSEHNIFTFEHVFPALLPGGLYVIEDLALHFGRNAPEWQGQESRNAADYFLSLGRGLVSRGEAGPDPNAVPPAILAEVEEVAIFEGAVAIRKKQARRTDPAAARAFGEALIRDARLGAMGHARLAGYLQALGAPAAEVDAILQAATGEEDQALLLYRADLAEQQGRRTEAVEWLTRATARPDATPRTWRRLSEALLRLGQVAEAEAAIRRAVDLRPDDPKFRELLASIPDRAASGPSRRRARDEEGPPRRKDLPEGGGPRRKDRPEEGRPRRSREEREARRAERNRPATDDA